MLGMIFLKVISLFLWVYLLGTTIMLMVMIVKCLLKRFSITKRHLLFVVFWMILVFVREFKKERKDILGV